ncbi:M48 family metallopeptidase [Fulvivirga sediminis]|uniref:M48 family metallopeptidase n=1 Tax=Fulvivirga sediminis TaxID=2803949 RepID=A0A937F442_9BACT|nr:M48 family metallopeptidase [Fulvivirga sediminis]MBL3655997.1 M48 family metallopeptidase [Fulvivirga sediminis]
MIKKILFLFVIGLFLYSCASVPVTGRSQLNLVSNSEILPMSYDEYQQVLKESKLSNNQKYVDMVKTVGKKIQVAVEEYMRQNGMSDNLKGYSWEFNVIDSDQVNAWCMPGGKVAFYSGIMPICQDETGVAVVMGHEVAHAVANHGRERMSESLIANFGLSSLSTAFGQDPSLTQQLLYQSVGIGTQLGMLKFSRTHESEADHIGLIFMAMAGYNPSEAPKFWERMEANSGGARQPEFLSTHPHPDTRIADLKKELPEALKYYKGAK